MKWLRAILLFVAISTTIYPNSLDEDRVIELYIASFKRAPDSAGLHYWLNEITNNNWSLEMVAQSMFMQPEAYELYKDDDLDSFIRSVYENVLNRAPDKKGFEYWKRELVSNSIPKEDFILAIINGAKAQGDDSLDAKLLKNRVIVSRYFAITKKLNDINLARKIIADVNSTDESIQKVIQEIDNFSKESYFSEDILNASLQIQYSNSKPIVVDKEASPYYKITDEGYMLFRASNNNNLKRVELRVLNEWGLDDFDKISLNGIVKLSISTNTNEVTFMQLHHKSKNAKPFVRLVYKKEKNSHPNSLWAVVRNNEDNSGDISTWYYLGDYKAGEFIFANISIIDGDTLHISIDKSIIETKIPKYWKELDYNNQRFYFKAGLYFSGQNSYKEAKVIYKSLYTDN